MDSVKAKEVFLVGGGVALVRVVLLWLLVWLDKTGQQTISALPLVLLLYPEGLILPFRVNAGVSRVLALSALLLLGSMSAAAVLWIFVRRSK